MTSLPIADASDFAAARAACGQRDSLVRQLAYFLPREKADGVVAIAAGCRLVRSTICETISGEGGCCGGGGGAGVVDLVRAQMERVFDLTLELPKAEFRDASQHVLAAFAATAARFEVPRGMVMDLVEGCRDDLATTRYATWNSLRRHCERVGGSAAQMIACVLGTTSSDVGRLATEAGAAGRLVRICAEVKRDLERQRIYLPLEDLARCGVSERELATRADEVIAVELERARGMLASASQGVRWLAGDGSRMFAGMGIEVLRWWSDRVGRGDGMETPSEIALVRMLPGALQVARR